ncbi:MAG: polysaccharide lyase family protein [Candidatus Brocadiia bacterium]
MRWWLAAVAMLLPALAGAGEPEALFCIGSPDGFAVEFGLTDRLWPHYLEAFPGPVVYTVGESEPGDWPYLHPSSNDRWAGSRPHTFTIRFGAPAELPPRLHLVLGTADAHPGEPSTVTVGVNGKALPAQRAPTGPGNVVGDPGAWGRPRAMVFPLPEGAVRPGANTLTIGLEGGSWVVYDYVMLTPSAQPPKLDAGADQLLEEALAGPLADAPRIVFALRQPGRDGHWYANFAYYAPDADRLTYGPGGKLCVLDLRSGQVATLLDDPRGAVRDPQVHYDGHTILFAYRRGDSRHYHLYEIQADGTGLRQITDGPWDDIEPTYLPDGGILFCSSRCKRWVNCWLTQVAVLYRCERDGSRLRMVSSNNEHDNTPWPLPDGRVLYTRWEYVDRSQVHYHHLWTANPDGTAQMVYYGNLHPGTVMIDAKPVPRSRQVVAIFSPGHGRREHAGRVTLVDPRAGPDARPYARTISRGSDFRDPYALSPELFLAARGHDIVLMDRLGRARSVYAAGEAERKAGLHVHEPRPLAPRPRERRLPRRVDLDEATGRLVLVDVTYGRNMGGVEPGEIQKLLVLETLPKPINFTGGMEPLSYGGTFTLERVVGTVPVEPDGSAYIELPALRSLFFVALDERDLSVKRMQSFLTVQPGETTSCAGCHEDRTVTPEETEALEALGRPPSRIQPIEGLPDVFDFPRDIQPILDRHCVPCHGYEPTERGGPRAGGVVLTGDRGPLYSHSYYMLTVRGQVADGRNLARSNYPPRAIGSSASPLMDKLDGSHHDVQVAGRERAAVRLWIDSGAPYPGTYAALGTGMIGGYAQNRPDRSDRAWPEMKAAMETQKARCGPCHQGKLRLPESPSDNMGMPPWAIRTGDPRLRFSRHVLYNLSRPEKSLLLLAPLAADAGGYAICTPRGSPGPGGVLASTDEPAYRTLLAAIRRTRRRLEAVKRFDMPGFQPRAAYLREMERYGVLSPDRDPSEPVDPYALDRAYWRSLWYRPRRP